MGELQTSLMDQLDTDWYAIALPLYYIGLLIGVRSFYQYIIRNVMVFAEFR